MDVELVAWSAEAERGLSETLRDERDAIKMDVDKGRAQCWKLNQGRAWMITRPDGRELVIVCYQGENFAAWIRYLYDQARARGFTSARFHTIRPALARLVPFPCTLIEYVYRVEIV